MHPVVVDTLILSKQKAEGLIHWTECFMTFKNGKQCHHPAYQYIPTNTYAPDSYMLQFCKCHMVNTRAT